MKRQAVGKQDDDDSKSYRENQDGSREPFEREIAANVAFQSGFPHG